MINRKLLVPTGILILSTFTATQPIYATGFLPQDARSLGMGGTGVAVGNSRQAHYYNPSLLVNAPEEEDFSFEADLTLRFSDTDGLIEGATDFADNDPLNELSQSIVALNNSTPLNVEENLNQVIQDSELLQQSIRDVTNKSFTLDANLGLFAAVPNMKYSGTLYANGWTNIGIQGNLANQDDQIMSDFISTAQSLQGDSVPDVAAIQRLVDADPTQDDTLSSSLSAEGAAVLEIGIAFATKQTISNYEVDLGITPKIQRVTTFGIERRLKDLEEEFDINDQEDPLTKTSFNLDIGISKELDENWTTGLVIKNLIPYTYDVANSSRDVKIAPSARIGAAWINNWVALGADLDLTKNDDIAALSETQYLALGAEFDVWLLQLRGGYRHNLASSGGSGPSAGLGLYLFGLNVDAAVASSSISPSKVTDVDNINASLQIGFNW